MRLKRQVPKLENCLKNNPPTVKNSPFQTMQAIYIYIAALIGLIFLALGAYGIVEHLLAVLLNNRIDFNQAVLVAPLAKIIVGLLIMVPHWMIGMHAHWSKK